jgi:hypothetical protein
MVFAGHLEIIKGGPTNEQRMVEKKYEKNIDCR